MVCASGHTVQDPVTPAMVSFLILAMISDGPWPAVRPRYVKNMTQKMGAHNTWSIATLATTSAALFPAAGRDATRVRERERAGAAHRA